MNFVKVVLLLSFCLTNTVFAALNDRYAVKIQSIPANLEQKSWFGSGILIKAEGNLMVLTAAHNIYQSGDVGDSIKHLVTISKGEEQVKVSAEIYAVSALWDIALLTVSGSDTERAKWMESAINIFDSNDLVPLDQNMTSANQIGELRVYGFKTQTIRSDDIKAEQYVVNINAWPYELFLLPRVKSFILLKGHAEIGSSGAGVYDTAGRFLGMTASQFLQHPGKVPELASAASSSTDGHAEMLHLAISVGDIRKFYSAVKSKDVSTDIRYSFAEQIANVKALSFDGITMTEEGCAGNKIGGDAHGVGGDAMGVGGNDAGDAHGIGGDAQGVGGDAQGVGGDASGIGGLGLSEKVSCSIRLTLANNRVDSLSEKGRFPFTKEPEWYSDWITKMKSKLRDSCQLKIVGLIDPNNGSRAKLNGVVQMYARFERFPADITPAVRVTECKHERNYNAAENDAIAIGKSLKRRAKDLLDAFQKDNALGASKFKVILREIEDISTMMENNEIAYVTAAKFKFVLDDARGSVAKEGWSYGFGESQDQDESHSYVDDVGLLFRDISLAKTLAEKLNVSP